MIKLLNKFTKDNEIVAWTIDEDGITYNIAFKGLYHSAYFSNLIDAGYVFHDYYGDVTSPEGIKISELPESEEYLSDSDLIDLIDVLEEGMLEEVDILSKFKRDINIEEIQVEVSSDPSLKTREDVIRYTDLLLKLNQKQIYKFNAMPFNSFTAKDALFTLEEFMSDDKVKERVLAVMGNKIINNVNDLKEFKIVYGYDENKSFIDNYVSMLKNYYKYGVPGLNAKIVDISVDISPNKNLNNSEYRASGILKYGVRKNNSSLFYSTDCIEGINAFTNNFTEISLDDYIGDRHISKERSIELNDEFKTAPYIYRPYVPQIKISMISEEGIRVDLISTLDEFVFRKNNDNISSIRNLFLFKTIDNFYIPMFDILNKGEDYIVNTIILRFYLNELNRKRTLTPMFSSSFEIYSGVGYSPYYIPMIAARDISKGYDCDYSNLNNSEFGDLYRYCSLTFKNGLSPKIIEKYGDPDPEFLDKSLLEQIDYINENIAQLRDEENNYLVKPELNKGVSSVFNSDYNDWFDEYMDNEVENVNFCRGLMSGSINIGSINKGILTDSMIKESKILQASLSLYYAMLNNNPNLTISDFLVNFENIVNLDNLIPIKSGTYNGCKKSVSLELYKLTKNSKYFVYVDRIFRENSNAPIDENVRHWGFQCYVINKTKASIGGKIFNSFAEQIVPKLISTGKDMLIENTYIAISELFISLAFNKTDYNVIDGIMQIPITIKRDDVVYKDTLKLSINYYEEFKKTGISRKICSCYDFCMRQTDAATLEPIYYPINATITPWNVIPKGDFKIPEYNLYINFFTYDVLSSVLPASFVEKVRNSGGKVEEDLNREFSNNNLFPDMSIFSTEEKYNLSVKGEFLEEKSYEDLQSYMYRTLNSIKVNKENKLAVKNTVLKSDIILKNFKEFIRCDNVSDDVSFFENVEFSNSLCNKHISQIEPRTIYRDMLNDNSNKIEDKSFIHISRIKLTELSYKDIMFNKNIVLSKFNSKETVRFKDGKIFTNDYSYTIKTLTEEQMDRFVEDEFAIRLNKSTYIFKTSTGYLKIGGVA